MEDKKYLTSFPIDYDPMTENPRSLRVKANFDIFLIYKMKNLYFYDK